MKSEEKNSGDEEVNKEKLREEIMGIAMDSYNRGKDDATNAIMEALKNSSQYKDLTPEDYDALKNMAWDCWPQEYAWGAVQLFKYKNGMLSEADKTSWETKWNEAGGDK